MICLMTCVIYGDTFLFVFVKILLSLTVDSVVKLVNIHGSFFAIIFITCSWGKIIDVVYPI